MTTTVESGLDRVQRLREQGGPVAAKSLLQAALEERDAAARSAAVQALAEIPAFDAVPAFLEAIGHDQRSVRAAAIEALGQLGDARAVEPLLQGVKDFELLVRLKSIEALGKIRDHRAIDPMVRCLRDRNTSVRVMSAEALGRIEDPRAIDPLLIAMAEANNDMRKAAMGAASNDPQARAMQDMNKQMAEEAWIVQWAIAVALGKIGGPRAVDALIAWSHRVFTSETKKVTADEKAKVVRDAAEPLLKKMPEAELRGLQNRLQASTRIKSWQSLSTVTDLFDWIEAKRENPMWTAIIEELERKRPASAPPPAPGPDGAAVKTVAAGARETASKPAVKALERYADPSGIIADFIAFLKGAGMESVVLLGGALRSPTLGREPNDIDITFQLMVSEDLKQQLGDPIAWNMQFAPQVHPTLSALAEKLGCHLSDLIDGKATFASQGKSIAVHYVGPFLIEEKHPSYGRYRAGMSVKQTVSRLGLVADDLSGKIIGLVSTAVFDQAWIDVRGKQKGQVKQALERIAHRKIDMERTAARPGLIDIFHVLFCKAVMEATLADCALNMLESAAAAVRQFPELALEEFSHADFDRLVSVIGMEKAVEAFDLLGLMDLLAERLDDDARGRLAQLRRASGGDAIQAGQARLELDAARAEAERLKEAFEAKTAELNQYADELDESKAAIAKLEEDLKSQVTLLSAADAANREAGGRLEAATARFREMSAKGTMDLPVLQEHREALAFKRERDAEFIARKRDVEHLRTEIEKKQRASSRARNEMETLGQELEAAMKECQETQARAAAAEETFRKLDGHQAMSTDRRRQILGGRPAA